MSGVAVLVPFGGQDPQRLRVWEFLAERWPWPVVVGAPPEGPWCKAAAVADALGRTDAGVLVIADADVAPPPDLSEAVDQVAAGRPWAVPHLMVERLTAPATDAVLAREVDVDDESLELDERPYRGHPGGGVVVLHRDVYGACPLDRRFIGWGHEDDAFGLALQTMHGRPWRGTAPLRHLWHPTQDRLSRRVGSKAGLALYGRYKLASRSTDDMARFLRDVA